MPSININLGDAFLLETPPNVQHLYIAIASISNGKYLFVNVTKRRPQSEIACILQPDTQGIPNFISCESVITYQYAREMDCNQLSNAICSGSPIPKCHFPPNILSQIQQGGVISKRLANIHKKSLKQFLGIP